MGDDIWNIMFAYGRWVFFIQVYASRWEVQYQVREVFSFKFELAIKGNSLLVLSICWEKNKLFINLIIHNLLDAINVFGKMINNIPINTYYLKHQQELYGLSIEFSNFNILCRWLKCHPCELSILKPSICLW
jgi:hypothetical protein